MKAITLRVVSENFLHKIARVLNTPTAIHQELKLDQLLTHLLGPRAYYILIYKFTNMHRYYIVIYKFTNMHAYYMLIYAFFGCALLIYNTKYTNFGSNIFTYSNCLAYRCWLVS